MLGASVPHRQTRLHRPWPLRPPASAQTAGQFEPFLRQDGGFAKRPDHVCRAATTPQVPGLMLHPELLFPCVMRRMFRPHPVYGYGFVPNLKARVPGDDGSYLVRTNALGFRSNFEFELRKPPGTFRIMLFGDSFSAADGVRNEDRYFDLLGSLLLGDETLNFAMPGTGTDQQYVIFREKTARFEYDLVVVAVLRRAAQAR